MKITDEEIDAANWRNWRAALFALVVCGIFWGILVLWIVS
jgi:hypothetical protein